MALVWWEHPGLSRPICSFINEQKTLGTFSRINDLDFVLTHLVLFK